jgi:hypothetical protein
VLLVLPRRHQRALEPEHLAVRPGTVRDQALDRGQVEAVRLHLGDQLDARHVLRPVVAGAAFDHRRLQQTTGLVRADVADGHPGSLRERVDRQFFGHRFRDGPHILRCFM